MLLEVECSAFHPRPVLGGTGRGKIECIFLLV